MSAFNTSSQYGASAFTPGSSGFNGGMLAGQGQGLSSAAAQAGFARGAAMQEHSHALEGGMGMKPGTARIREVWRHNLDAEFHVLRQLIRKYPYVSMDAEFPGIVARPIGTFAGSKAEYHYQTLRCNVDILKPIQVGITLWTPEGDLPPQQDPNITILPINKIQAYNNGLMGGAQHIPCTWVFNFQFNLEEDMYSESSIELLKNSGVDFQRNQEMGISLNTFGSLLTTSGLAFNPDVHWLSFHSGYDFGYLIKLLSDDALPVDQTEFFEQVRMYFPKLWDIKFLLRHAQRMRNANRLSAEGIRIVDSLGQKSGLSDLADELGCQRVGAAHTAGSDAWLTGSVFWAMKAKIFNGTLEDEQADQIYGLHGVQPPASQQYREEFFAAQGTPGQQTNGLGSAAGANFTPGSNNPSTPTNQHAGLNSAQTPGAHYGNAGGAGAGGHGFGNFHYGK
jgi:CCR4-NOT transcription complex subunit 7/8